MKLSPSMSRILSIVYLPIICGFSYFASYWLNHAINEFGESTVKIPLFGLGYLGEWLPLGTALLFFLGLAPSVYATFVNKWILLISPIILGISFLCFFLVNDDEMGKQIIFALSSSQMFGIMVGTFVQSFKPISLTK